MNLEKYSARPITLSHDGILINGLLRLKRGTLEMRIAVSQRTRELLAYTSTYDAIFLLFHQYSDTVELSRTKLGTFPLLLLCGIIGSSKIGLRHAIATKLIELYCMTKSEF
jgi:hypothetical protein